MSLKTFSQKHSELWKFLKFNITVVVTSALDIAVYMVLLYAVFKSYNSLPLPDSALLSLLGIKYQGYLYSYLISTTAGYVAAYLINRKITFHSNVNPVYSSVLYFILAVFNILVSSYIGGVFGSFMTAHDLSNPVTEIIAKFVIINIPTIWTYPAERFVIQIQKKEKTYMKSVIASDLDGTFLKSDTTVSRENLEAVERLSKIGVKTIIVTGRTLYEIPAEIRNCKYIDYFVYSNGAGIESRVKGMLYYSPIERATAKRVFDILNEYDTFIEFYSYGIPYDDEAKYSDESFAYYKIQADFLPEMYKSRKTLSNFNNRLDDSTFKLELLNVLFRNMSEREECYARLQREFPELEITTSMINNLEIMNKGVNKGTGLKKLCEIAGIDINSVSAVGDSKNDITFFNAAGGRRFAVSNACDELKSIADEIICSNDENVMCFMEEYYNE
ncbi:MAG: Cof-type HAD-IIB family hydrolase [Eubacterium sp.]